MKADIFINRMAGNVDFDSLRIGIHRALFRCETRFWFPDGIPALHAEVRARVTEGTDALIFCGGDGTVNTALKPLIELRREGLTLPACCVIPVGTANDLASSSGISRRIDRAARVLLEGHPKPIDVIEVDSGEARAYMITNGGIGLAANTADQVNQLKSAVKTRAQRPTGGAASKLFFGATHWALRGLGSTVYELAVARELLGWQSSDWKIRVTIPRKATYITRSPLVLVSNQPRIGGNFTTAPFTRNDDGLFNVLIVEPARLPALVKSVLEMRRGHSPSAKDSIRFETDHVTLEAMSGSRAMKFFGDGEVLFQNARQLDIRCTGEQVPFWVSGGEHE